MTTITTDLSKFGTREIEMAKDLLDSWLKSGLPEGFYKKEVQIIFNQNYGNVFLTNSEGEVAMINFDTNKLEKFYNSPDQEWFKDN